MEPRLSLLGQKLLQQMVPRAMEDTVGTTADVESLTMADAVATMVDAVSLTMVDVVATMADAGTMIHG